MHLKTILKLHKKFILCLVVLYITSCKQEDDPIDPNPSEYTFSDIEEMPIDQNQVLENWDSTGWGVYEDIIFNGTNILYNIEHDDNTFISKTLKTEIEGGDSYNNVFFTNTVAKKWEDLKWPFKPTQSFTYSLNFYPEVNVNCSISNLSEVEGLEFTMQHVITPNSWGWGIQWSKTNVWSYWNDEKINGSPIGWENINSINTCVIPNQWNSIIINGTTTDNSLTYNSIEINSEVFELNILLNTVTVPTGWSENFIQVGFQINGNDAISTDHNHGVDPVTVFLDNLNLKITN
ncbi:hypothetical protein [Winogradskyella sp. PE311]|uniref:hypothetical protein n=1 Tax=Winogradskyella sp. PE311 TaxID=3366943 RepID=UPI0039810A78